MLYRPWPSASFVPPCLCARSVQRLSPVAVPPGIRRRLRKAHALRRRLPSHPIRSPARRASFSHIPPPNHLTQANFPVPRSVFRAIPTTSQKASDHLPNPSGFLPRNPGSFPKTSESIPKILESLPESPDRIPHPADPLPASLGVPPAILLATPTSVGVTPGSRQLLHHPPGTLVTAPPAGWRC